MYTLLFAKAKLLSIHVFASAMSSTVTEGPVRPPANVSAVATFLDVLRCAWKMGE